MKKNNIFRIIAAGMIVLTMTACGNSAPESASVDPQVLNTIKAQSYETKLKNGADYMGITVAEAESSIAQIKPSCRAQYNLLDNRELNAEEKNACIDMESLGMFDK